jgi:hypothetical protein
MNLLLEYAYLRTLDIRQDNVCQLLRSADYLNIPGVLELCCDYLRLNLTPENCIGIMLFAKDYFCRSLEIDARRYILRNFVQVRKLRSHIPLPTFHQWHTHTHARARARLLFTPSSPRHPPLSLYLYFRLQ